MADSIWKCEPVIATCGFSGSGKTTLLETAIPRLAEKGLRVVAVKHDAHGLSIDTEGKDSDRLYRAGADVIVAGPGERVSRRHVEGESCLEDTLAPLLRDHDIVLVEGHKTTPLPKVWLLGEGETVPPEGIENVLACLKRGEARLAPFLDLIHAKLDETHRVRPRLAGLLVGGKSRRFGHPKQFQNVGNKPLLKRVSDAVLPHVERLTLVGDGDVPSQLEDLARIVDAPDCEGPLAGLLSALRWAPRSTWLAAACDLPSVSDEAIGWLLAQRRPGSWAVIPRVDDDRLEPLLAVYEPQSISLLESLARRGESSLQRLRGFSKVSMPEVPAELRSAWTNVNTPEDLERLA